MNLKLGFTYRKFSGSFTLENMLDRFYYQYLSYYRDPFASGVKIPEPGRNFFAHLRYSFGNQWQWIAAKGTADTRAFSCLHKKQDGVRQS